MWYRASLITLLLLLLGCSQTDIKDHENFEPALKPEDFFSGQLKAHGLIKNRNGTLIRTFSAEIDASWEGKTGTLVEDFIFDDGEQQQRIWVLERQADNTYVASANDVVGESTLRTSGNSLFLKYVLTIPYRDSTINVNVDDRMYLLTPDILVNESTMKKFGWRVGSILLVIEKQP